MPAWVICSEAAAMTWGNYRQASAQPPFKSCRIWILLTEQIKPLSGHSHYMHLLGSELAKLANVLLSAEHYKPLLLLKRGHMSLTTLPKLNLEAKLPKRWKGGWSLLEIWQRLFHLQPCAFALQFVNSANTLIKQTSFTVKVFAR